MYGVNAKQKTVQQSDRVEAALVSEQCKVPELWWPAPTLLETMSTNMRVILTKLFILLLCERFTSGLLHCHSTSWPLSQSPYDNISVVAEHAEGQISVAIHPHSLGTDSCCSGQ